MLPSIKKKIIIFNIIDFFELKIYLNYIFSNIFFFLIVWKTKKGYMEHFHTILDIKIKFLPLFK